MLNIGNLDVLESLNENGSPPKTRIKDAISVRNMWAAVYRAYTLRHRKNALVKGLVDGNPPWPDKTRDAQRYKANFNNGEGYAYLETSMTAFYDVYSEPETYATIECNVKDPEAYTWGETMTRHFDWLQRQDDAMDFNHQLSIHDTVLYGTGPQLFLRKLDWRSSAVPSKCMYVSDDSRANVADWEWCIFQFDYTVSELYDFISDEEMAKTTGWSAAAVKRAIMASKPGSWGPEWNTWMRWQETLRNNDIWLCNQCNKVRVVRMLFKEFSKDGELPKITECWVSMDLQSDEEFLMHQESSYDDMREAVCAFYYDRGDGTHQSIKGLGVKMFPLLTSRMRLQLAAVDAAFATSTVFVSSNAPAGRQTLSNVQFGAMTVLPAGMGIQQANLQGVLEPALAMSQDMGRTLDSNLSQYRQRMELPSGNPPTKFQVQAQLAQSATLGKTQLARYHQQLDELYTEKYRRACNDSIPKNTKNKWLKLALEFQKKCRDDGVPRSAYEKCTVRATRIAGQGSHFLRQQSLVELKAVVFPDLPEDGKERLNRDITSSIVGANLSYRYWGNDAPSNRLQDQVWQAQVEHGLIFDGGAVTITPQQNDTIHLTEHFGFLMQAVQSLQGGGNTDEVFNTLVAGRAHVVQHLIRMSSNPSRKQEFEQFKGIFDQLNQSIEDLTAMLQERGKQQAIAQQEMQAAEGEMDAATAKTKNKIMLDQIKTQAQLETKGQKSQQDMQIKQAKAVQDLTITQAKANQDVTRQAIANAGLIAKQRIENERPPA